MGWFKFWRLGTGCFGVGAWDVQFGDWEGLLAIGDCEVLRYDFPHRSLRGRGKWAHRTQHACAQVIRRRTVVEHFAPQHGPAVKVRFTLKGPCQYVWQHF
jgi:hypothetical protein